MSQSCTLYFSTISVFIEILLKAAGKYACSYAILALSCDPQRNSGEVIPSIWNKQVHETVSVRFYDHEWSEG